MTVAERELMHVLLDGGIHAGAAATFIHAGRRILRSDVDTLALATARALEDHAAILEGYAADLRHAAHAARDTRDRRADMRAAA